MTEAQKALQKLIEDRPAVRLLVEVFGLEADQVAFDAADADPDAVPSAAPAQQAPVRKQEQQRKGQQLALF